ncbi:hypothetical protein OH492_10250 [Vibrio chagasii]|nr:hypothetical protein [Vibrio chagasii]
MDFTTSKNNQTVLVNVHITTLTATRRFLAPLAGGGTDTGFTPPAKLAGGICQPKLLGGQNTVARYELRFFIGRNDSI